MGAKRVLALLLAVLLLVLLGAACGGGGGDPPADPTPNPTVESQVSGPEAALAAHVRTTMQKEFAPDCSKIDVAQDVGKICAAFRGEREGRRAYVLGLTFSEFSQWAIVEQRGGQWAVIKTVEITTDNSGVPGIPWPLRTGVDVVVVVRDSPPCLNVREEATLQAAAVDCINDGTTIQLQAGPQMADGIEWWQVEGRSGWVSADYLRYPDAAQ